MNGVKILINVVVVDTDILIDAGRNINKAIVLDNMNKNQNLQSALLQKWNL
jgi:hypothetical protein